MEKIYLDNASTTFPKPDCVAQAVYEYMTGSGVNINRGCYDDAYAVEEFVLETRELLCELFDGPDCRNVIFTKNVTESLNVILKGFLKPGDHVMVSSMEHNAVMRPLVQLGRELCIQKEADINTDIYKQKEAGEKADIYRQNIVGEKADIYRQNIAGEKADIYRQNITGENADTHVQNIAGENADTYVQNIAGENADTHVQNVVGENTDTYRQKEYSCRQEMDDKTITFTRIPCDTQGNLLTEFMESLLRPNTRAVIMMHASNVCGTVMPIREVGAFCQNHNLKFIVDCAQTAGVLPVSMKEMNIDALAFTGHKGLLGPQGIGGFILTDEMVKLTEPLISGGTGSISHTEEIPEFMPDRFEPGTMNLPGIMGLRAGLLWLKEKGTDRIWKHELELTGMFIKKLEKLEKDEKIRILGRRDCEARTGVVSIQTLEKELSEAAYALDADYGIMTRVGLHCAPSAHKSLQTYPTGTIRFSFGWNNTEEHVEKAVKALEEICYGI